VTLGGPVELVVADLVEGGEGVDALHALIIG